MAARSAPALLLAALLGLSALPATGQTTPARQLPFVTLDDDQLFSESLYGQAVLAELDGARQALMTENREIEAGLARREQELTQRRATTAPAEFRAEADRFNAEVESHRNAQREKERALYQRQEEARQRFQTVANQVLAEVMAERGALAIISEDAILLGFRDIDITEAAIARLDALIGDGGSLGPDGQLPGADAPETPNP